MITSMNLRKRLRIVAWFTFIGPFVLGLIAILLEIFNKIGAIDLMEIFQGPIYSNYSYTFLESVMDFDKLLGELIGSIVFALIITGFLLLFNRYPQSNSFDADYRTLGKRSLIGFGIAFAIIVLGIIGSLIGFGMVRPNLTGKTFQILASNFYIEHLSEQLFIWLFFGLGFVLLPLSIIRGKNPDGQINLPNKSGIKYLFLAGFLIEILLIIFPIQPELFFSNNMIGDLFFSILQCFIIVGVICIIDRHRIDEELETTQKEALKFNWHQNYFAYFVVVSVITLIIYIIIIGFQSAFIDISAYRWMQNTFVALFRIMLVIGLYYFDAYYQKINSLTKEEDN